VFVEISSTTDYVKSLEEKFSGLSVPSYKLKEWFTKKLKIFFNCEKSDKTLCLDKILEKTNLSGFKVFLIVKQEGCIKLMDVNYRNLGKETLEHFINRYESQLKSMTQLSLKSRKTEYIETVGYSYQE
jgi:hypothetical protein